jgi:DNA replication and repair protein RecF
MILSQLHIHSLRSITQARIDLHPRCNIFVGKNGSGKTSLLEAIYMLGTGHSFRTREITPVIQDGQESLTVFSKTDDGSTISLQKSRSNPTVILRNQAPCKRASELAYSLPCLLLYQDIFQIMDAGPAVRRSLLDWGLFHVKPEYLVTLNEYRKILKQRNALLRQNAPRSQFVPWDNLLVTYALQLHALRSEYISRLSLEFKRFLVELTGTACDIQYYNGWDKRDRSLNLHDVLNAQFASDQQRQYTQAGPHQADLLFRSADYKASQILSRGQQKICLIALKLAQSCLLAKPCLYLLDDITAELDEAHVQRLLQSLLSVEGQLFITCINKEALDKSTVFSDFSTFELHQGCFT